MPSLETRSPGMDPGSIFQEEFSPETRTAWRRQAVRGEFYGLAVLIGLELAVVYVIGSLILTCLTH